MKKTLFATLSLSLAFAVLPVMAVPAFQILPLRKNHAQPESGAYKLPALQNPASWTFVLFPDTQAYVKYTQNTGILDIMNAWIAGNIRNLNIQFALGTGDIANTNGLPAYDFYQTPFGPRMESPPELQFQRAARSFGILDGLLPCILCTGNHDYGHSGSGGTQNRDTWFNDYFPVSKNPANLPHLRKLALNARERPTLENAAFEFLPPNGMKILVLSLEFLPRDEILEWAKKLCADPRYENHTVILLTHLYLNGHAKKSTRIDNARYKIPGNHGEAVWQKLVKPSKNIRLVLSGHIGSTGDIDANTGFRTDKNDSGKNVHQMAFNAHATGGGWDGNGGDGWLRYFEFLPDNKTVVVRTFSPFFALSVSTRDLAWRKDPRDEFTFVIE